MYIPLWNKSNYTLLSSLLKVDDLIAYAEENKLPSIAIADSNMFGVMEFIKKCEKKNINPVIGLELIMEEERVLLYAKDYVGYQMLMKLSTIQNERKIEEEDLHKYNKNVIGVLPFEHKNKWEQYQKLWEEIYLGYKNKQEEKEALILTKNILFFPENLYLESKEKEILPYLYRIRDGKTILDEMNYDLDNHELKKGNLGEYSDNQGIIQTLNLAEKCKVEFPPAKNLLPIYPCEDPKSYLFELCKVGLKKRLGGSIPEDYKERLVHELKVINDMGFPNYFLIVYDLLSSQKRTKY